MMNGKRVIAFFLILMLTLGISVSALALGDTLRWGVYSAPKGWFHPAIYTDMYDAYILMLTYSPLVIQDESSEEISFIPQLAESWNVSEDGLSLTFYLRKDVKWHDGVPFTADDVVFNYTAMCDARVNSTGYGDKMLSIKGAIEYNEYTTALMNGEAEGLTPVEGVEGIVKEDDYTVTFIYSEPYAPALVKFADSRAVITPKHIWENIPFEQWRSSPELGAPVGTGPYKFVKYEQDQYTEFVRNEDYFGQVPAIEHFIYKVVNQDTAQAELLSGDLDVVSMISDVREESLKVYTDAGMIVVEKADAGYQYMNINLRDPKLSDVRVRQAIAYAIDRQAIVDNLLNGHGIVLDAPMIASSWAYPKREEGILNPYDYDLDKAKELLAEAGWTDTDGDGFVDKDGQKFAVSLIFPVGNKVREQSAPIIAQYLKIAGIDCSLEAMDFNSLSPRMVTGTDFELGLIGLSIGSDPDVFSYFHSSEADKGNFNMARYEDADMDALIEASQQEMDPAKRKEIFYEINTKLNYDLPFLWLYSANEIRAITPKLKNYDFGNFWEFMNVETWHFEE
ncbi:MAG: peptide-binding protein [Oscillospiraceae bacterium]|nr:peptide-binding protein [Oscillospiraceae bacterium]